MCGRYTLHNTEALRQLFRTLGVKDAAEFVRRFNVAPTQELPVIVCGNAGPETKSMRWGARWLDGEGDMQMTINARSEKLGFTRFQHAAQERRCLVPACGFFEWDRTQKPALPYLFEVAGQGAFWIAGIWEDTTDEFVEGYLVLTTKPNEVVGKIHDRMPVILDQEAALAWLRPGSMLVPKIREICATWPAERMTATRVNPAVNNARNDGPECVAAIDTN